MFVVDLTIPRRDFIFRFGSFAFGIRNGAGSTKVEMGKTPASFWGQFHEAREPVLAAESFRSCYYLAIVSACCSPLDCICSFELDINCLLIGPLEKRSPLSLSEKRFQVGGRCSHPSSFPYWKNFSMEAWFRPSATIFRVGRQLFTGLTAAQRREPRRRSISVLPVERTELANWTNRSQPVKLVGREQAATVAPFYQRIPDESTGWTVRGARRSQTIHPTIFLFPGISHATIHR